MKSMHGLKLLTLAVGLAIAQGVLAQTYKIESSVIAGGGGSSTGGVYSISGTIGQHDAGRLTGGNYSLEGGFWGMVVAFQTSGAPTLKVTRSGNTVIISWPDPSTGFGLQEAAAVSSPPNTISWGNYGGNIPVQNGEKTVTFTQPTGNRFFRLLKQP